VHNILSIAVMKLYNATGIFSNADDTTGGLRRELEKRYRDSHVKRIGSAALFWARRDPSSAVSLRA